MPPNVPFNLIDIMLTAVAASKRSHSALIEHKQPRHSMSTKTSKERQPTFLFGDTPGTPSTTSNLPEEQDSES